MEEEELALRKGTLFARAIIFLNIGSARSFVVTFEVISTLHQSGEW